MHFVRRSRAGLQDSVKCLPANSGDIGVTQQHTMKTNDADISEEAKRELAVDELKQAAQRELAAGVLKQAHRICDDFMVQPAESSANFISTPPAGLCPMTIAGLFLSLTSAECWIARQRSFARS